MSLDGLLTNRTYNGRTAVDQSWKSSNFDGTVPRLLEPWERVLALGSGSLIGQRGDRLLNVAILFVGLERIVHRALNSCTCIS